VTIATSGSGATDRRDRRRVWRVRWSAWLGSALVRVLGVTWRVRQVGDPGWRARRAARAPLVLALWHGDLLPAVWAHRGQGVVMLVSEHADGEIIARIGAHLGQRTVRGSTSRGAARALLGLVRALRDGDTVAITPDGPRGPRHHVQAGAAAAANRASAPVVAIGVACSRAWTLRSWDGFRIPKPFSTIVLAYTAPAEVPADVAEGTAVVAEALMRASVLAEEALTRG